MSSFIGLTVASLILLSAFSQIETSTTSSDSDGDEFIEGGISERLSLVDVDMGQTFFTENLGQLGPEAGRFFAKGKGLSVAFGRTWVKYRVEAEDPFADADVVVFTVTFRDANPTDPSGEGVLPHRNNYLIGSDASQWVTNARSFREVWYRDIYDSINLRFTISEGRLKYEFIVHPGGDPYSVKMMFEGLEGIAVEKPGGDLLISTTVCIIRDDNPYTYQPTTNGEVIIDSSYVLLDDLTVGFKVAPYDPNTPLIIDPTVNYGTFLGGQEDEEGTAITIGPDGCAYVTGYSDSYKRDLGFNVTDDGFDQVFNGTIDAFISKFSKDGSQLLYSTLIGGDVDDISYDIKVDGDGCIYITGKTNSTDFPTTTGAFNRTNNGQWDVFVLKLNTSGDKLLYSTLFGGVKNEVGRSLDIDSFGNVYVTGTTGSSNFPTTSGALDEDYNAYLDVFVTKISQNGSSLVYSTFVGGIMEEEGYAVCVDASGNAYVGGYTQSQQFPTTSGSFDGVLQYRDAFVFKLNSKGSAFLYSTFLGGDGPDYCYDICIDEQGYVYLTGQAFDRFPTTPGAFDRSINSFDVFVSKLSPNGNKLEFSTFLGGGSSETGYGICIDGLGRVYVTGDTKSDDFPKRGSGYQGSDYWGTDWFISQFSSDGSSLLYSTYVGGYYDEHVNDITTDSDGNVYIIGRSRSKEMPVKSNAYLKWTGWFEVYILSMKGFDTEAPGFDVDRTSSMAFAGETFTFNISVTDDFGVANVSAEFWRGNSPVHQNISMELSRGNPRSGTWMLNNDLPMDDFDPLHYRFHAKDGTDALNTSVEKVVPSRENLRPHLIDRTNLQATTGDLLTFTLDAFDNAGINRSQVVFWFGDDLASSQNISMTGTSIQGRGNGTYEHGVVAPSNSTDPINYFYAVLDVFGNWNVTNVSTMEVLDNDAPSVLSDGTVDPATTGDPLMFRADVADNIGVTAVHVTFWYGGVDARNESLVGIEIDERGVGTWVFDGHVYPPDTLSPVYYFLSLLDAAGNWNLTEVKHLDATDNDPPEIGHDALPGGATTGDILVIGADIHDNIGPVGVNLIYWIGEDEPTTLVMGLDGGSSGVNGIYIVGLPVPRDAQGTLFYYIEAIDGYGNLNRTTDNILDVVDDDVPWFGADMTPGTALKGTGVEFSIEVFDNGLVEVVHLVYLFGEEGEHNRSMESNGSYTLVLDIPRGVDAPLHYQFSAKDGFGNWNSTPVVTIETVNDPPELFGVPPWDVTEGVESSLDLSPYLSDGNDPLSTLELQCNHPDVIVDGLVLKAVFDVWAADLEVEVGVYDGEDTSWFNITVDMENVNDLPVIGEVLPTDGTTFKKGKTIEFTANATDEDGDVLQYTWYDGEDVIGTGGTLSYSKLGKGDHEITLEVSDGTGHSEVSFIVKVMEEGSSPMGGAVLAVGLLTALGVLLGSRRRSEPNP